MSIDPTEIAVISSFAESDLGSEVITHGILQHSAPSSFVLLEDEVDYRGNRLPMSLMLDLSGVGQVELDGEEHTDAYCLVQGTIEAANTANYHPLTVRVEGIEVFDASDEHASTTSQSKVHKEVISILRRYDTTIPTRYVVETAVEEGYDRDAVSQMIERLRTAGEVYEPEQGHIGVL